MRKRDKAQQILNHQKSSIHIPRFLTWGEQQETGGSNKGQGRWIKRKEGGGSEKLHENEAVVCMCGAVRDKKVKLQSLSFDF
jgi:hypothetical protein